MKPKLLFLSQSLPFPPDGGVQIRTYNILKILSKHYSIHLLCFFRAAVSRELTASVTALRDLAARVEIFPIPQEFSRARLLRDHVESVLLRRPYTRPMYRSAAFLHALRESLRQHEYALVHLDSLDLSFYVDELRGLPLTCTHHNVESALLRRRSTVNGSFIERRYYKHQASLLASEEARLCPSFGLNVVCSSADQTLLSEIAPQIRSIVVPNGVDTAEYQVGNAVQEGIVFVGGLTWYPNLDALDHYTKDIRPVLLRSGVDSEVVWVGRATSHQIAEYAGRGVRLTGYVDSIKAYVDRAKVFIAPLRIGGGTRLKILNAWAMGKAVVSTSVGCEGLNAVDGENILIRDDPSEFARAVTSVITDEKLRGQLERNARRTAEEIYDWRVIARDLVAAYSDLSRIRS